MHQKVDICSALETRWKGESAWKSRVNTVTTNLSKRVTAQGTVLL